MARFHVMITDVAWDDLDLERSLLAAADAEMVLPTSTDQATLAACSAEHQVDAIMTNWADVSAEVVAASPRCRIVARLGVGLDNIDLEYCSEHGIPVTNVPDYCQIEVAEHALALILALGRNVAWHHWATKSSRYDIQEGPALQRIAGQTLGIVGLGTIGRRLAEKARGVGLNVIGTSRSGRELPEGVKRVELAELLSRSDYVSLHLPLTPETRELMGREKLALMKPTAFLINTARGGLIDHAALTEALAGGWLAGAGLDVQSPEPPDLSQPPYNDPRVIVTPHIAFVSRESLLELRTRACRQVVDRLEGRAVEHVVNGVDCQIEPEAG